MLNDIKKIKKDIDFELTLRLIVVTESILQTGETKPARKEFLLKTRKHLEIKKEN